MDKLIQILGLSSSISFEELPNCIICNLDKDKILVICSVKALKDIDEVINRLPGLRKQLMEKINNENNKALVQNEKIPMSKFLWDMYVIGLHKIESVDEIFKSVNVSEYERDRFIARKIIIQYEHLEELKRKFDHFVFPERILNSFTVIDEDDNEESVNYESIQELIKRIDSVLREE